MANNKNGFERQDAILGTFARDARSTTNNSATAQAIKAGREARAYREKLERERTERPNFVFGSPAHLEYMEEQRAKRELAAKK